MKPSQIAWLASLVAFICTALIAESDLLSPTIHRYINIVSIIATAVSAFMLQRPAMLGGEPPAYFVVEDRGVLRRLDKGGMEAKAMAVAEDMPQPLTIER